MEQINHTICDTYVHVYTKFHLALKIAATRVTYSHALLTLGLFNCICR
jgi:hypothetical protein